MSKHSRMIWTTTRTPEAQRDLANSVLGGATSDLSSKDIILFHYGTGVTPTQAQIDALKAVTKVTDIRKGFEFFNLADLAAGATIAKNNGFGIICYDLEQGGSPQIEVDDPVGSFTAAKNIATSNNLVLHAAPSHAISSGQYADDIAKLVTRYHLQSQPQQDDDVSCTIMRDWVADRVSILKAANPNLVDRITFQVTLTNYPASGKTIYQTAKDCIDATIPSADGLSIWWGGSQWDSGDYQALLTYFEDTYS